MNENLDLVEVLKDCPKGTKFYSTIYGDVYFDYIELSTPSPYSITLKCSDGERIAVTNKGKHYFHYNGECTLFPSRDQRDWSKWQRPFKDGDIIFTRTQGIMNKYKWVSIFKEFRDDRCVCYINLCLNNYDCHFHESNGGALCYNYVIIEQRLATENEKQKLFDVLKSKGYKWNFENKTLEKLIIPKFKVGDRIKHKDSGNILKIDEIDMSGSIYCCGLDYVWVSDQDNYELVPNKFDPKTLKPFDMVLVRDNPYGYWITAHFSHIEYGRKTMYIAGTFWNCCIPYNDDTAHLIGTDKEAPEYYRYWEK